MKQLIQPIYKECVYYKNLKDNKIITLEKHSVYGKLLYIELPETKRETINSIDDILYCTYKKIDKVTAKRSLCSGIV